MLIMKQQTKKKIANSQFQKKTIAFKYCDKQLTLLFKCSNIYNTCGGSELIKLSTRLCDVVVVV